MNVNREQSGDEEFSPAHVIAGAIQPVARHHQVVEQGRGLGGRC